MAPNGTDLASWDTSSSVDASMTEEKLTEIMVRLERLDAGQRYVIEQLGNLQVGREQNQSAIDKLESRLDKVEWNLTDHERRVRPWRSLAFSMAASVIAAVVTYLLLHHV